MYQCNDNELLYLIYEGEEEALGILIEKYIPLIYKRIRAFKIKGEYEDDYFQEGLLSLFNSTRIFNPMYTKSFNKFFDMVLQRRYQTLLQKNKKKFYYEVLYPGDEILREDGVIYTDPILSALDREEEIRNIDTSLLSKWEKEVFDLRYLNSYSVDEIVKKYNCSSKKVYNAIYQIKRKLKNNNDY